MNISNIESEKAILGGVFVNQAVLDQVSAEVMPTDFSYQPNRIVYKTMVGMHRRGDPIELKTVLNELEKGGHLERVGGKDYVVRIVAEVSTSAGWRYHVQELKAASKNRALAVLSEQIMGNLKGRMDPDANLSEIRAAILKMGTDERIKVVSMSDALARSYKELEILSEADGRLVGIPSGIERLDKHTGGWKPGNLIIIAGRPGMGKSVLAKDFAENAGVPITYFNLEMTSSEVAKRSLASEAELDFGALMTGRLSGDDWGRVLHAVNRLQTLPVHFIDSGSLTLEKIIAQAQTLKLRENIGLVIVDYLQLIRTQQGRNQTREQVLGEISRGLKGLARDLDVPVICLSQLNRQCEARENKRPRLSDLRESGAIEQDADVVIFIYRDAVYNKAAPENVAELIIAKGRNIRTGTVHVLFDGNHQRFLNLETRYGEGE